MRSHLALDRIPLARLRPGVGPNGQQKPEAKVDDADDRKREEHPDGDDDARQRDVEAEILGEAGANAEDHAAPRIAVQPVYQAGLAKGLVHCCFLQSGTWLSRIVSRAFTRLCMAWLSFQRSSSILCSSSDRPFVAFHFVE